MKIYKKCPCCNKTNFLILGSDFGNEIQLASAFGVKDNMPHQDTNHSEDYQILNDFLNSLQNSHGQVFLSLTDQDETKIPQEFKELILKWKENYQKPEEEDKREEKNWKNIHLDFVDEEYKQNWIKVGFTYEQTADWINCGMKPIDYVFCSWLREFKKKDVEWVLNHGNMAELRT